MELSLSKLPWYAQIGAFVAVCAGAVFGFWHFYVQEVQADITIRQARFVNLKADVTKGMATARRLPEFESQVSQLEQKLESLRAVLPEEKDVADILRRIQAIGDAVEPDDPALHAAADGAAVDLRRSPVQAAGRRDVSQPRLLLRSDQQVPANHQHQPTSRSRRTPSRSRTRRSSPNALPPRSCCKKDRWRARRARAPCRSSRRSASEDGMMTRHLLLL